MHCSIRGCKTMTSSLVPGNSWARPRALFPCHHPSNLYVTSLKPVFPKSYCLPSQSRKRSAPSNEEVESSHNGSPCQVAKRISVETPSPTTDNPLLTPLITDNSTSLEEKRLNIAAMFVPYNLWPYNGSLKAETCKSVWCDFVLQISAGGHEQSDKVTLKHQFTLHHIPQLMVPLSVGQLCPAGHDWPTMQSVLQDRFNHLVFVCVYNSTGLQEHLDIDQNIKQYNFDSINWIIIIKISCWLEFCGNCFMSA